MSEWREWTGAYFAQMQAVNRSPGTVRLHRQYLAVLERRYPASPRAVTLAGLVELMNAPTWGADAKRSARAVWRGFFKWAHGVGLLDVWVGEQLQPVTMPRRLPRPAPELVVRRATGDVDPRIAFMCQLGAHAGLRAGEIAQVHESHLDGDLLRVRGKGAKDRVVPIEHDGLLARLERVRGWAFPSTDPSRHLTPGHVSRLMSAALPDGWTAHTLRHRYATAALDGSDDLLAVAELLGHASVATTQIYTKVSVAKLRRAARAAA